MSNSVLWAVECSAEGHFDDPQQLFDSCISGAGKLGVSMGGSLANQGLAEQGRNHGKEQGVSRIFLVCSYFGDLWR